LLVAVSVEAASAKADEPSRSEPAGLVARVAVAWLRAPGAEGCISPEELVDRTRARAPASALVTLERRGADFVVIGRIVPHGAGFRTEIQLRDAHDHPLGERTFDSKASSCRTIDESLVLALLLLVETHVPAAPPGPPPTRAPVELPELAPPLRSELLPRWRRAPLRLPPPSWRLELGLGAAFGVGFTPEPTAGATLYAAITPPRSIPFVVRAAAYPYGVDARTIPGEGIEIRDFELGADVCPFGFRRGELEGLACAGARAAFLLAEPLGPQSSSGALFFFTLPLRAEARLRLSNGLAPYAAVVGALSPLSPSFTYRANGQKLTSFEVSHVTLGLELGLAWQAFP
jgi:hypothetical protein